MRGKVLQTLKPLRSLVSSTPRSSASNKRGYTSTTDTRDSLPQPAYQNESIIYESHYPKPELPNKSLWASYMENQMEWSHKPAVTCGLTGRQYTYAQIKDNSLRFAFSVRNITKNINLNGRQLTIAALLPNCPEWPVVMFGTAALGGILTPINASYNPAEVARHIINSGAHVIVVESLLEPIAEATNKILKEKGIEIIMIVNGKSKHSHPNLQELFSSNVDLINPVEVDVNSTVFMPYSSGTSGVPKGVEITHAMITNNLECSRAACYIQPALGNDQGQCMGLLPFFHIYGSMAVMLQNMMYGSNIVTQPKFDPKLYISVMQNHKITGIDSVPSLLQFMALSPDVKKEHLQHTQFVTCGSASVPPAFAEALRAKAGTSIAFQEVYGMTEVLATHLTPIGSNVLGSCGRLLPLVEARIVNVDTQEDMPPGGEGELLLRCPWQTERYHNNPEATADTIDSEGWLHTGDVATVNDEGYFSIVDRLKELIKVKGVQVSPSEVEGQLLTHPGIAEVAVIGVAHERAGEVPKAFIVKRDPNLTEEQIHQHAQKTLSTTKQLVGGIQFIDALPRNATGKLMKRLLH